MERLLYFVACRREQVEIQLVPFVIVLKCIRFYWMPLQIFRSHSLVLEVINLIEAYNS